MAAGSSKGGSNSVGLEVEEGENNTLSFSIHVGDSICPIAIGNN